MQGEVKPLSLSVSGTGYSCVLRRVENKRMRNMRCWYVTVLIYGNQADYFKASIMHMLSMKPSSFYQCRFSLMICEEWARFLDYYDQRNARLSRDKSVYEDNKDRSYVFRIISAMLFFWPHVYVQNIEDMWVDRIVNINTWSYFFEHLQQDWKNCITPVCCLSLKDRYRHSSSFERRPLSSLLTSVYLQSKV